MGVITRPIWKHDPTVPGGIKLENVTDPDVYGLAVLETVGLVLGSDFYSGTLVIDPATKALYYVDANKVVQPIAVGGGVSPTADMKVGRIAVKDTNASHHLFLAAGSDLTADRQLSIITGDASRGLSVLADVALNQNLRTSDSPTFATVRLGAWTQGSNYAAFESASGPGYLLIANSYDGVSYLNGGTGVHLRAGGTDKLTVTGSLIGFAANVSGFKATGIIEGIKSGGSAYWDGQIIAGVVPANSSPSQISLFPGNFGNQWREAWNDPNSYVRTWNDAGYYPFYCDVIDTSSARYKADVVGLRERITVSALDRIKALRPVYHRMRREQVLMQLVDDERGHVPRETVEHVCGPDCISGDDHSLENPCVMVQEWQKGRFGLVAEEVAEVLPEVTHRNNFDGQVEGIKTLGLVAVLVAAVQELSDTVTTLTNRIAQLEGTA